MSMIYSVSYEIRKDCHFTNYICYVSASSKNEAKEIVDGIVSKRFNPSNNPNVKVPHLFHLTILVSRSKEDITLNQEIMVRDYVYHPNRG